MDRRILVINLGSTSTKVAVYEGEEELLRKVLHHSEAELAEFPGILDQKEFRKAAVLNFIVEHGYKVADFACVVSRGGISKPISGGIYELGEEMVADMASGRYGLHPGTVGCMIGLELKREFGIPAITANTPCTDELSDLAKLTGIKGIDRVSQFHALNHKAIARRYAKSIGRAYHELNLIIAHLGGGISVGAHEKGRAVDVNNALDGDGPFSPERAGGLPVSAVVRAQNDMLRQNGSVLRTEKEMLRMVSRKGGLMSYLGTNSGLEAIERILDGDRYARLICEGMAYQVSKEIGSCAAVLKGRVDAILLTGSLAYSEMLNEWIRERVEFIAPVAVLAGEDELHSLAENAVRFLEKVEICRKY